MWNGFAWSKRYVRRLAKGTYKDISLRWYVTPKWYLKQLTFRLVCSMVVCNSVTSKTLKAKEFNKKDRNNTRDLIRRGWEGKGSYSTPPEIQQFAPEKRCLEDTTFLSQLGFGIFSGAVHCMLNFQSEPIFCCAPIGIAVETRPAPPSLSTLTGRQRWWRRQCDLEPTEEAHVASQQQYLLADKSSSDGQAYWAVW